MKIGLIGCGFIGNALKVWIKNNNPNIQILINDPQKNYYDDVYNKNLNIDVYFIQIHVPTLVNGTQKISSLIKIIEKIPKEIPIWIRTTITQTTLNKLREINPIIEFLPEFLTQRTAIDDFKKQKMIFTGNINILKKIFIGKKYIEMSSEEAILAKYAHNCFGALKVTYFNCINQICEENRLSYDKVLNGILASRYINDEHTKVPGPDGKFGYGGKCFPKDVDSFTFENKKYLIFKLIKNLKNINNILRN